MRYGMNFRRLEGQRLGIGRYLENLLDNWRDAFRPDESAEIYLRAPLAGTDGWIRDNFDTRLVGPRLTGLAWENISLPRAIGNIDVFFGPSYTVPLTWRGPCVVANHSINETAPNTHPWWYQLTYATMYRLSARKSLEVIVPSPMVADKLSKAYDVPASRIHVVREGAPNSFAPETDPQVIRDTRLDYTGSDAPYILFVGKFSQRRNIPLLIRAFARMKSERDLPHNLLLLGPNHLNLPLDSLCRELGVEDSVTVTNRSFDDHDDIIPVFSAADLYAFPSLFEGASNTTVEAMACGVPVVAGRCEAIADIVEGSGVLIDEVTVENLAEAMGNVLTDRGRWTEMRDAGLAKAATLRWSSTAQETLDILRETGRRCA